MKTFIKPIWWIPVFFIPQVLLYLYESSIYAIVKTELPEDQNLWPMLAGLQLFLFLSSLSYIGFALLKKKSVHWIFPVLMIFTQIPLLAWFFSHQRELTPWSVPRWMIDQDEFALLFFAFTMPVLFFSILQLVSYSIKEEGKKYLPHSIGLMLVIPAVWYVCMNLLPSFYSYENQTLRAVMESIVMILAIVSLVIFFFFLIRILLLISGMMIHKSWVRIVMVVVCCLLAPLLGLWINNKGTIETHMFGDFSHWSFYVLTILNAALLLIPSIKQKNVERALVALRFFTLPFSLYFLIVFIPFLPLSIAAIIFAGAGILLLAPVLNFIIHVYRIYQDLENKEIFPTLSFRWLIAIPIIILPLTIHFNYLYDKQDLQKALTWVYNPNYSERTSDVDPERISYVLDVIANAGGNRGMFNGRKYWKPYLSSYYRWLVLDNLTLSGRKVSDLEQTFLGTNNYTFFENPVPENLPEVYCSFRTIETKLDKTGMFYRTNIEFELKNETEQQQEYIKRFTIPEGAWISDYYLYIGDKKEPGILAEKRTAQWVYQNIVNRRRDPGIISYTKGNEVELRVFPMESKEIRRTGFEIIHTCPVSIEELDLKLDDRPALESKKTAVEGIISEEEKGKLPLEKRNKKYYLLIDNSLAVKNPEEKKKLLDRVQLDLKMFGEKEEGPVELFSVNHSAQPLNLKAWRPLAEKNTPEGGFFVERIMKSIMVEHYVKASDRCPVFLIYSNRTGKLAVNLKDLAFTSPDIDCYFVSGSDTAYINAYDPAKHPEQDEFTMEDFVEMGTSVIYSDYEVRSAARLAIEHDPLKIVIWKSPSGKKLPLRKTGTSVLSLEENFISLDQKDPLWKKAVDQQKNIRFLQLHPERSEEYWRKLVGQNFETGILSPYTSYLVVETEAQKEVLRQKQKEVMNAAQYFDIEQEFISMAEPEWYWYLLVLVMIVIISRKGAKTQRQTT